MNRPLEPSDADRERHAIDSRRQGLTYDQIAQSMNLSGRGAAWKIVQRGLERGVVESAEDLRVLESHRLDAMQLAIWEKCMHGDLKAIDSALRIMERRARLFGLDSPSKISAQIIDYGGGAEIDFEVARLVALLNAESEDK